MEIFDRSLELLSMIGNKSATRSALERCCRGFFAEQLPFYEQYKIIFVRKASDARDDKFYLTELGKKLWRQEISIKDIVGENLK